MRFTMTVCLLFSGFVGLTLAQQGALDDLNLPEDRLPGTELQTRTGRQPASDLRLEPGSKFAATRPDDPFGMPGKPDDSKVDIGETVQTIKALKAYYQQAERDSARYAAELQSIRKDGNLSKPDPVRQKQIETKLTDAVQRAFKLRHRMQMEQVKLVEQNLRNTRGQLHRREQNANRIIHRRVEELSSSQNLSWTGKPDDIPTTAQVVPDSRKSSTPVLGVYPRDTVNSYIAAAIAQDEEKASRCASADLTQPNLLKQWGTKFRKHPPAIQNVLVDKTNLHSHVMVMCGDERLLFELKRSTMFDMKRSTGDWRLTAISRPESILTNVQRNNQFETELQRN